MSSQICITIDDVPAICDEDAPPDEGRVSQAEYMGQIAEALRAAQVRPIFFVNSDRIRADLWSPVGLLDFGELGNHTASHCSVDDVSIEEWAEDVRRCNAYLHSLTGQPPRWFRYPYLRTGSDAAKIENARDVLRSLGLHSVPGSCAPLDWLFARFHVTALNVDDEPLGAELARRAMDNIIRTIENSADEMRAVSSEPVPLTLVLHASPLLGRILPETLDRLREKGARFTSFDAAMEAYDKLSAYDEYRGPTGPPYLLRLSQRGRREIDLRTDWLSVEARRVEQWWRHTRRSG